ncbi:MAG TPA: dethiobiotin synthase [Lentisphaeria bacterium]|nr:MAG: dethiobiotin synthase [Lentisphaerae bacterium GWF2_49_21]HBC86761.1 dethiobiotin synthase [Lentisphaeria bacterium]
MKNHNVKYFFVTGTGTGVGKTIATAGLAALFSSSGRKVAVMKPVQTGLCESIGDLEVIRSIAPGLVRLPDKISCPYSFSLPASPALAASVENKTISPAKILAAYHKCISYPGIDTLLVEGAGGLMVPVKDRILMIDLISLLKIPAILVADAGLGTLNHSLLSIEAMKRRKIRIAGIILNRMPKNPGVLEKDNIRTLERLSEIPVIAVIETINSPVKSARFADELLSCLKARKLVFQLI